MTTPRSLAADGWQYTLTQQARRVENPWWGLQLVDPSPLYDVWAAAYVQDDVVAKVVDKVVDAMLGRGVEVLVDGECSPELVESLGRPRPGPYALDRPWSPLAALGAALRWERLFGGGAILLGVDDGQPLDQPLDETVSRGLDWVVPLDPRELRQETTEREVWLVRTTTAEVRVHESRLILFRGWPLPHREASYRRGWGVGVVERVWDEISRFNAAWAAFSQLIKTGNQDVWKLRGLIDAMGEVGEDTIVRRMELADRVRSVSNSILLDSEAEDFLRIAAPLTGAADAIRASFERLAMAVGIPVVVLVGISPAGLNATGESDRALWEDSIEDERAVEPAAGILRLARLVARSEGVDPAVVTTEWPPVRRQTPEQLAASSKAEAEADSAQVEASQAATTAGYVTPEEARRRYRARAGLPAEPTAVPSSGTLSLTPVQPEVQLPTLARSDGHVGEVDKRGEWEALVISAEVVGSDWGSGEPVVRYELSVPGGALVWEAKREREYLTVGRKIACRAWVARHVVAGGRRLTEVKRLVVRGQAVRDED